MIKGRIFAFDYCVPVGQKDLFKRVCYSTTGCIFAGCSYLKSTFLPRYRYPQKKQINALFSNTFLYSKRYAATCDEMNRRYNYRGIQAACDGGQVYPPQKSIQNSFARNHGNSRPIMLFSDSVAGKKLKKVIWEWCVYMGQVRWGEAQPDKEKTERLLALLEKAYTERKKLITKALKKADLSVFVTVNQYNLRDVLIIDACHDLGIRTVQQAHHAWQFSRFNYSEDHPIPSTNFVKEIGFWSDEERRFYQKVFAHTNPVYKKEDWVFSVTGTTELTYEAAQHAVTLYKPERRLTFMTAALEAYDLDTEEQLREMKKWRWAIYRGLRKLAAEQDITIRVRYTPWQESEFRREEIPILQKWGFEISESLPSNLMEDMCTSIAVMSSTSTVLATAKMLGRIVYRVEDPAVTYVQIDPAIHDVKIAEIENIRLPEDFVPQVAPPDAFFMVEKLLEPKE